MQECAGTVLPEDMQGAGNIPGIIKTPTCKYQSFRRRKKWITRLLLSPGTARESSGSYNTSSHLPSVHLDMGTETSPLKIPKEIQQTPPDTMEELDMAKS